MWDISSEKGGKTLEMSPKVGHVGRKPGQTVGGVPAAGNRGYPPAHSPTHSLTHSLTHFPTYFPSTSMWALGASMMFQERTAPWKWWEMTCSRDWATYSGEVGAMPSRKLISMPGYLSQG